MVSRLTREIAFYRKYHRHPVNVALHILFIPTILATSLYGLTSLRWRFDHLNFGVLVALYYLYFYAKLDGLFGASLGALIVLEALLFSSWSAADPQYGRVFVIWAVGWIAQFIGHGAFEGRAPALLDNVHQALVLAPYFAVLEVLSFLGVRHAQEELQKVDLVVTR